MNTHQFPSERKNFTNSRQKKDNKQKTFSGCFTYVFTLIFYAITYATSILFFVLDETQEKKTLLWGFIDLTPFLDTFVTEDTTVVIVFSFMAAVSAFIFSAPFLFISVFIIEKYIPRIHDFLPLNHRFFQTLIIAVLAIFLAAILFALFVGFLAFLAYIAGNPIPFLSF